MDYSKETIEKICKNLAKLLKEKGSEWKIQASYGKDRIFNDKGTIKNFKGAIFVLDSDDTKIMNFNPPPEIEDLVKKDSSYESKDGIWIILKALSPSKSSPSFETVSTKRNLIEEGGGDTLQTSSQLEQMSIRKLVEHLLNEAESFDALYGCLLAEMSKYPETEETKLASMELKNILETIEEDEESPKRSSSKTSPKTSPKTSSKRSPSPKQYIRDEIEETEQRIIKLKNQKKKLTDQTTIKKINSEIKELNDELDELREKLGFGHVSRKSNRKTFARSRMSRRRKLPRTSRSRRNVTKHGRSLKKKTCKRKSLKTGLKKRLFGSTIYGLQGGLQNGPIYPGVYPMSLNMKESYPNLFNVKRTYKLNEFGKPRTLNKTCGGCGDDESTSGDTSDYSGNTSDYSGDSGDSD